MKSTACAIALLLAGLVTAACSGDDPAPSSDPDRSSETGSAEPGSEDAAATEGVITPADVPEIPRFRKDPAGVIGDVAVDSCDTEPGDVTASGTATNSGRSARDVVVAISWTVGDTGDVVARGVATLEDLEPGEEADWDVDATVPGSQAASCVTTALAGEVAA